ncbi:MBL fold metallo-hydrolase [Streptomyces sp. NPDC057287]|uniref:MBL fold metallo-hydrolase n=1 Tax=Streptomyces sp. NPDC057287 TaxID=3346086 RepID=UPI003631273E
MAHSPGRTPGSIAVHLPRDVVLCTGDAVAGVGRVMQGVFNTGHTHPRSSFRRLAALSPAVACFGAPVTVGTAAVLRAAAG